MENGNTDPRAKFSAKREEEESESYLVKVGLIGESACYLHADMRLKKKALSHTEPLGVKPTRYKPDDKLLAFLEGL